MFELEVLRIDPQVNFGFNFVISKFRMAKQNMYGRLNGLRNLNLFLTVLEPEVQDQGARR